MTLFCNRFLIMVHVTVATILAFWLLLRLERSQSTTNDTPKYTLQIIALPGYRNASATGVNANNTVFGVAWQKDQTEIQPWVWANGRVRALKIPRGIKAARALGINRRGQIVGVGSQKDGGVVGILWDGKKTSVIDRSAEGVRVSFRGINDRGQIIGHESSLKNDDGQAVLWNKNSKTILGKWQCTDINEQGIVTGTVPRDGFTYQGYPVVCKPGEEPSHLSIPNGFKGGQAYAINRNKQVAGYLISDWSNAVLWNGGQANIIVDSKKTGMSAAALGINDKGQVVGWMERAPYERAAFLWQNGKRTILQDTLPEPVEYTLTYATSVNNAGGIVGAAYTHRRHYSVAYLLLPRSR